MGNIRFRSASECAQPTRGQKAYLLYLLLARTSPLGQKEAVSSAQTRPCLSTLRKDLER